ncbi:MAG TPA: hypothetical protein VFH62_03535 [Dehalococcoidia bacterium]|jgi:hypothetical protein|nr:hypothetical protein [Dehalococcoidia bacterium]
MSAITIGTDTAGATARVLTIDEIRFDAASAAFLNALRKERRVITPADYGNPMILKKSHVPNLGLA